MIKYLIFDLDWTLIRSNKQNLKIVLNEIEKYDDKYLEKAKYLFSTTPWMPLYNQLNILFGEKNLTDTKIKNLCEKIYKKFNKKSDKIEFFEWVSEKIIELSKKYKIFLTTWNSTKFAKNVLEKWGIIECFDLIFWSDEIKKWSQHLDIFKNYSEDESFFDNSIYFWDWDMDKLFALEKNIKFVRVWDKQDINEEFIDSIANIDNILGKYKDWLKK